MYITFIFISIYIYTSSFFSQLCANTAIPLLAESSSIAFFQAFFHIHFYLSVCISVVPFITQQIFIYEYHSVEA